MGFLFKFYPWLSEACENILEGCRADVCIDYLVSFSKLEGNVKYNLLKSYK